jgi:HSP20 family molecular chaperone IbpA
MKLGLDDINTLERKLKNEMNNQVKIEPDIDIYDEGNECRVVILTNNVEQKDIKITNKDNLIIFEAGNSEVLYYKEIAAPCLIDDNKLTWAYKNGITEITISKEA